MMRVAAVVPSSRAASRWFRCCSRAVDAQLPTAPDDRFAGLQWRFVRIQYHYIDRRHARSPQDFYGEPWYIDAPAAEQNLSRRVKTATAIQVEDPIVLTLDDPRLFTYPWIYFVEPGNLKMLDSDVAHPARVPAARRHGDVRRFSRPVSSGRTSRRR